MNAILLSPCAEPRHSQRPLPARFARTTILFSSDAGLEYLYDDVTGSIFPWSPAREYALRAHFNFKSESERAQMDQQFGRERVDESTRFIRHWWDHYAAFVRPVSEPDHRSPTTHEVTDFIRNQCTQLTLTITEDCNLRCNYCIYSGKYLHQRQRTSRAMSASKGCEAIDWFFDFVAPQLARHPGKKFGLTFYGGEPLLNIRTIEAVLEHCSIRYPGLVSPTVTTNGTLLAGSTLDTLVKYNVHTAVSIDGPQQEHDRNRVYPSGAGSHADIMRNLEIIRARYPTFWANHVVAVSVYDDCTNLAAVAKYFSDSASKLPPSIFVNMASPINTSYYGTEETSAPSPFAKRVLAHTYKEQKMAGESSTSYLNCLIGAPLCFVLLRSRVNDLRTHWIPFSGSCMPGYKIAVATDGTLHVCERVNGTYPIGHLDDGGIDSRKVCDLIDSYDRTVLRKCTACCLTKMCPICFSHVEERGGFRSPAAMCARVAESTTESLREYVSIMERNREADFASAMSISSLIDHRFFRPY